MENDPAHAKRLDDNLNRRNEFANPETTVAVPSEGRTDATKRARQAEVGTPQESADSGGASGSSAEVDVDMRVIHACKRPLDPGDDEDMVCGLDVCDELDELDENSFSDTYVNDREGDYTDEVTGVTLLRDDVAKAREEFQTRAQFILSMWGHSPKKFNGRAWVRGRLRLTWFCPCLGMEFQGDVEESSSVSSGSLSPHLVDTWRDGLTGTARSAFGAGSEGIDKGNEEISEKVWEGPWWEGMWPFLDPWDVVEMRMTASSWNVPSKYGPHGELFFFLIKKEPTFFGDVVDLLG